VATLVELAPLRVAGIWNLNIINSIFSYFGREVTLLHFWFLRSAFCVCFVASEVNFVDEFGNDDGYGGWPSSVAGV